MTHVLQVPPGYACRALRTSLPLGVLGLYANGLGIWAVVVCATPDRVSLLVADSWVGGMVASGYNLVMEEMDWVGPNPARANVVFCHHEGVFLLEGLLGDLRPMFEIVPLDSDVTGIYAGFTNEHYQITALKHEALGFPVVVHPNVQQLVAAHKIDTEVFRLCQFKEHVMFTGLWWSPFGPDRLAPNLASADEEDLTLWEALQPDCGSQELLKSLEPLVAQCVAKRGGIGPPDGPVGPRYFARSAVDSVAHFLKNFDAERVFAADMREAMALWGDLKEDGDEELYRQLSKALETPASAFGVCSGLVLARRSGAAPEPTGESTATPENNGLPDPEGPIIAPSTKAAPQVPMTKSEPVAPTDGPVVNEPVALTDPSADSAAAVVAVMAEALHETEDLSPYAQHMRAVMEVLAAQQHTLQMYRQKQERLAHQKAHVAKVYAASMRDFRFGDYDHSKEGFFECLRLGTLYMTAADTELSSAYYNAGRAFHLAGLLQPAREVLKTCLQLRNEQLRCGIIDQSVVDKTKQAFQQVLHDCHKAAQPT